MATELRVNPNYFPTVREEEYERIKRYYVSSPIFLDDQERFAMLKPCRLMKKDDAWSAKNASIEVGLLCSRWVPTASANALRAFLDYNH